MLLNQNTWLKWNAASKTNQLTSPYSSSCMCVVEVGIYMWTAVVPSTVSMFFFLLFNKPNHRRTFAGRCFRWNLLLSSAAFRSQLVTPALAGNLASAHSSEAGMAVFTMRCPERALKMRSLLATLTSVPASYLSPRRPVVHHSCHQTAVQTGPRRTGSPQL